jgi:4-amino-4-deoxychorismate lyase
MKEFLFLDGKRIEPGLPMRSLFFGEGVFETFRWKSSPPVYIKEHVQRMKHGAELLQIPFPGEKRVMETVEDSVNASGLHDAYVKVCLLSSGPLKFSTLASGGHLLVVAREYEPAKEKMNAHVVSFKQESSSPLHRVKSLNYLENVLARREADDLNFDEGIFLNEKDEVTEGSATNIFWVKDNTLFTPAVDCGLLPGVTRMAMISFAGGLGLKIKEGRFSLKDLLSSEVAFLTNALIGAAAITEIDDKKLRLDKKTFERLKGVLHRKLKWA